MSVASQPGRRMSVKASPALLAAKKLVQDPVGGPRRPSEASPTGEEPTGGAPQAGMDGRPRPDPLTSPKTPAQAAVTKAANVSSFVPMASRKTRQPHPLKQKVVVLKKESEDLESKARELEEMIDRILREKTHEMSMKERRGSHLSPNSKEHPADKSRSPRSGDDGNSSEEGENPSAQSAQEQPPRQSAGADKVSRSRRRSTSGTEKPRQSLTDFKPNLVPPTMPTPAPSEPSTSRQQSLEQVVEDSLAETADRSGRSTADEPPAPWPAGTPPPQEAAASPEAGEASPVEGAAEAMALAEPAASIVCSEGADRQTPDEEPQHTASDSVQLARRPTVVLQVPDLQASSDAAEDSDATESGDSDKHKDIEDRPPAAETSPAAEEASALAGSPAQANPPAQGAASSSPDSGGQTPSGGAEDGGPEAAPAASAQGDLPEARSSPGLSSDAGVAETAPSPEEKAAPPTSGARPSEVLTMFSAAKRASAPAIPDAEPEADGGVAELQRESAPAAGFSALRNMQSAVKKVMVRQSLVNAVQDTFMERTKEEWEHLTNQELREEVLKMDTESEQLQEQIYLLTGKGPAPKRMVHHEANVALFKQISKTQRELQQLRDHFFHLQLEKQMAKKKGQVQLGRNSANAAAAESREASPRRSAVARRVSQSTSPTTSPRISRRKTVSNFMANAFSTDDQADELMSRRNRTGSFQMVRATAKMKLAAADVEKAESLKNEATSRSNTKPGEQFENVLYALGVSPRGRRLQRLQSVI